MYYRLSYENFNKSKHTIKGVLLTLSVVLDIFMIYTLICICLGDLLHLIYLGIIIAISTILRIIALKQCYQYNAIIIDNQFVITKIYPIKSKIIVDISISKIHIIDKLDRTQIGCKDNFLLIIDDNSNLTYYMIDIGNKILTIPIDSYFYYLLTRRGDNDIL